MRVEKIPESKKEWLAIRKNYIGASEAAVLMHGKHFEQTPYKLWEEKVGFGSERVDNPAMQAGRLVEERARQIYERMTGVFMRPMMVFNTEKKFMMATLDGLSLDEKIVVEIKKAKLEDHELAKMGKVPQRYYPQNQHQLACTGHDMQHYFSYYSDDDVELVEVARDNEYIAKLEQEEAIFWKSVLSLKPPELTDADYRKITADEWRGKKELYDEADNDEKRAVQRKKDLKKWFVETCEGQSSQGFGLSVRKTTTKGLVNYKSIIELKGVDLERYRGKLRESWTIRSTNSRLSTAPSKFILD
jgi:putative phage-type endonuclease